MTVEALSLQEGHMGLRGQSRFLPLVIPHSGWRKSVRRPLFVIPHSGWRGSARRVMRDPGDWGRFCGFVKKEKAFNWVPHLRDAHASLRAG